MAKLITTQAEKDAASYLDWDDASLGRMCKKMALAVESARQKLTEGAETKPDNGLRAVMQAADGMLILSHMVDMNAREMKLRFDDYTHGDKEVGQWEIVVRQIRKPAKRAA